MANVQVLLFVSSLKNLRVNKLCKNVVNEQNPDAKFMKLLPEVFYKEDVLKNFAKFTGKHLCWSFFDLM